MKLFSEYRKKKILSVGLAIILAGSFCGCSKGVEEEYDEYVEDTEVIQDIEDENATWDESDNFDNSDNSEVDAFRTELYQMGLSPNILEWNIVVNNLRSQIDNTEAIEVDLRNPGAITDVCEVNGEVTGFTLNVTEDKAIPFEAKGVTFNDDGSLRISETGYICSLKEIEGLFSVGIKGAESYTGVLCTFGVNPADNMQVTSSDELLFASSMWSDLNTSSYLDFENQSHFGYFKVNASEGYGDMSIAALEIYESGEHHGIGRVTLNTDFYGWLREGDYYDSGREIFDLKQGILTFYILCYSDVEGSEYDINLSNVIAGIEDYVVGDLHAEDGLVKAKTEPLALGDYLDVTVKGVPMKVELPICPAYTPETMFAGSSTSTFPSTGDLNVLVIPFYYSDQTDHLQSDMEVILNTLGNVVLPDGTTQNRQSAEGSFTLSDYYSQASYGKLNITSYVTDWYMIPTGTYNDNVDRTLAEDQAFEMQSWVNANYSEWREKLDSNKDDIYDAVIAVCASTGYVRDYFSIISVGGAVCVTRAYGHWYAHDGEAAINRYVQINVDMLYKTVGDSNSGLFSNVLLHETGHGFGLIDFYDVYHSGFNAVGGYDMQSDNYGDWNPYSKFAAGWTNPTVLTAEDIGDGTTVTLSKFTETGDTLVIPTANTEVNADGTISPFNEYIMVDLFSPDGLNTYDAKEYQITETGVRVYHVDARLIGINYEKDWEEDGYTYDVLYANAYSGNGKYHINLLQRSGRNTFTAGAYRDFGNEDLFKKGDYFSMQKHAYAFCDGKMNDGSEFPYVITVVSLTADEAVIEIKPITH